MRYELTITVSEPLVLKPDRTQARLRSLAGTIIIAAKAGRFAEHVLSCN